MDSKIKNHFWIDAGFYFSFVMLIWIVLVAVFSFPFPYRGKLFPLIVCAIGFPLIILEIMGKLFPKFSGKIDFLKGGELFDTSAAQKFSASQKSEVEEAPFPFVKLLSLALWFAGFLIVFMIFGYLPATVLFLFCFLKFYAHHSWKLSTLTTLCTALVLWGIFTILLEVPPINDFWGILGF